MYLILRYTVSIIIINTSFCNNNNFKCQIHHHIESIIIWLIFTHGNQVSDILITLIIVQLTHAFIPHKHALVINETKLHCILAGKQVLLQYCRVVLSHKEQHSHTWIARERGRKKSWISFLLTITVRDPGEADEKRFV